MPAAALAPLVMANPWLAVGLAVLDFGFNALGASSSNKARKRAEARYREAVAREQVIWDREVGPVQRALRAYIQGTEGSGEKLSREASTLAAAESATRMAAPAIAENAGAAAISLSSDFAGRGITDSGVYGQARTALEQQRLGAVAGVRGQALAGAQQEWVGNASNLISLAGPRPSTVGMERDIMSGYSVDQQVNSRALVSSLMSLAADQRKQLDDDLIDSNIPGAGRYLNRSISFNNDRVYEG